MIVNGFHGPSRIYWSISFPKTRSRSLTSTLRPENHITVLMIVQMWYFATYSAVNKFSPCHLHLRGFSARGMPVFAKVAFKSSMMHQSYPAQLCSPRDFSAMCLGKVKYWRRPDVSNAPSASFLRDGAPSNADYHHELYFASRKLPVLSHSRRSHLVIPNGSNFLCCLPIFVACSKAQSSWVHSRTFWRSTGRLEHTYLGGKDIRPDRNAWKHVAVSCYTRCAGSTCVVYIQKVMHSYFRIGRSSAVRKCGVLWCLRQLDMNLESTNVNGRSS